MSVSGAEIYNIIASMAKELGFVDFGCAKASEIPAYARQYYTDALNKGYFARMDYLGKNIEKRFNPQLLVEGAKSVLVFLAPYSIPEHINRPKGIAQFALGDDYHKVIKDKLFLIMKKISDIIHSFNGRAFTDSAPVLERFWAAEAGLGWIGRNNFLISKKCGIKNLIGVIICNTEIPPTADMEPSKKNENTGSCGECFQCIKNCPTGALEKPFATNANKCISYHTIENRSLQQDIDAGVVPLFSGITFGCDKCLDACPWNKANQIGWMEFHKNIEILSGINEDWWENLNEAEFKEIFKDSSILRGGLNNIKATLEWGKGGK